MIEVWKTVKGAYQVSNLGRFKYLNNVSDIIEPDITSDYIRTSHGYLHRLVAENFVEKPSEEYIEVNHKNFCKNDNRAENLEWVTHEQNMKHLFLSGRHTLPNNRKVVKQYDLDGKLVNIFESIGKAALYIDCHRRNMSNYCNRGTVYKSFLWTKEEL